MLSVWLESDACDADTLSDDELLLVADDDADDAILADATGELSDDALLVVVADVAVGVLDIAAVDASDADPLCALACACASAIMVAYVCCPTGAPSSSTRGTAIDPIEPSLRVHCTCDMPGKNLGSADRHGACDVLMAPMESPS